MSVTRLSDATLGHARPGTRLPSYDRRALGVGIVHLGIGAFVRAHLAEYTEDALASEPGAWGIAGVSLQRPDQRDRLAPQAGLYTMLRREGANAEARIVGCLRRMLVAPENPAAVVAAMHDPSCRIVSLTVTEKGYCHNPATGRLNADHPDIRHDLANPGAPRTAVGLITAALAARRGDSAAPFVVLCCDNLPHNGRLLAGLVCDFAALRDDAFAGWIEANVAFPSTMVDRIVPAATPSDLEDAVALTGLADAAPVSHEPFRQWVIEDRFGDSLRPAWEKAGAQLVTEVAPFEHMKLRLLNGAHSALAYLGYLTAHATISATVADEVFRRYVRALWNEIVPVVPPPLGVDLQAYTSELLARFANTAIQHRTWQIAMDGSQKLPQRLLGTIRERLARGLPTPHLALAVAAWIRYVGGIDEAGQPIDVRDPLATSCRAALNAAGSDPRRRVGAILGIDAIFGADLAHSVPFADAVSAAYAALLANGARAATLQTLTV
ncbi:MAG TPA: mannitol dehydrogenase family protein [Acetobacteraceae bacterium]|jgi:fructuronate reductase|nr:mannitol dehydrogenase family protein [Acetobacteraceae bacterium]